VLAPTAGARVASAPGTGEYAFLLRYQAGADAGMVTLAVLGSPGCTVDLADESAAAGASFEVGGPGLDSAMVRLRGAVCRSGNTVTQPDSAPATLHLTALDTAYSRFRRETDERGSLLESRASAGLSGAVGFFGAAAATQVPIVLVRTR
jgi:hypothetical protein